MFLEKTAKLNMFWLTPYSCIFTICTGMAPVVDQSGVRTNVFYEIPPNYKDDDDDDDEYPCP